MRVVALRFGGVIAILALSAHVAAASAQAPPSLPLVNLAVPAARDATPVVLTGSDLGTWAVPQNVTAKLPLTDLGQCQVPNGTNTDNCAHNNYAKPEVDTGNTLGDGIPVDRFLGYRYEAGRHRFVQIPFQVDKVFTRYLDNAASGFAIYSGDDQQTTYQFDREGFRYTKSDPSNPCLATPDSPVAKSPISGLSTQDELSFMASDAGPKAPSGAQLPKGIVGAKEVALNDPTNPTAATGYVYVMQAAANGPRAAFNASNGYVRYTRDANADYYEFSQSNYSSYGNAPKGVICDDQGHVITDAAGKPVIARHRPRDWATVTTPRYSFRYDGRWLMDGISISPKDDWAYGPNLVDRWKARAFAQDPSSKTPCCGFEEEQTHWGGSSTLMGERVGPVRAIRVTWGADSGTNVVRADIFYRDMVQQKYWLRVHPIPPLDGIYTQWDFRAGRVQTFYNPYVPGGVPIDGKNDTVFGNLDDPCNDNYNGNALSTGIAGIDPNQTYRQLYQATPVCSISPYHQSVNVSDPTFEGVNAALAWSETAGTSGTIVDRWRVDKATDITPGGAPQMIAAFPYYRDDSCFDDGTGSDPGPRINPGDSNEPRVVNGIPRRCWTPADGVPAPGDTRFFQGDIATHGLHFLFEVETDNARQTIPVDEVVSEQELVMLRGNHDASAGEQYGRSFEKPLVPTVGDYAGATSAARARARRSTR